MSTPTTTASIPASQFSALRLSLVAIDRDGIVRVACEGTITADGFSSDEKNPLAVLLGETWSATRVVLNLEKVNFIDSFGIGWLINSVKEFRAKGGGLAVHGLRPNIRRMLDLLKIGKVLPLADNEAAAKTLLK